MQDVGFVKAEGGIAAKGVDVRERAGAQIVHHINLVAVRQMAFRQMRSDETRSTRDQNMHIRHLMSFRQLLPNDEQAGLEAKI
jgi:hypothetical protein